jgi:hypothetical protein
MVQRWFQDLFNLFQYISGDCHHIIVIVIVIIIVIFSITGIIIINRY